MSDLARISVSLPAEFLEDLDRRTVRQGYASRSEFVRDLVRERLIADRWDEGGAEVMGVLTIGYDHHQRGLTERIVDAQHHGHAHVVCNTHVHMDHQYCLEVIILRGRPEEVEALATRIGGIRGVRFAELTRAGVVAR